MDAGGLNERITLQARTQTAVGGASGTIITEGFVSVATVWAKVEGLQGGRYVAGRQVEEVATHRVTIRRRTDFQAWRFILRGETRLEVRSLRDPDGGRQYLELWCEELKP